MAVAPITQPLAPGISAVDYSPWSPEAQARSATPGILNYVPNANLLPAPTASPTFQGGAQYGNYVRNYPDLMAAFKNPASTIPNIQDFGKWHWEGHGQYNPSRILPPVPVNTPISLPDISDTGGAAARIGTSGLPQPDVEGYKYEYPIYSWNQDNQGYEYVGSSTADIDEYPYYPYYPGGGQAARSRNDRILIGHRLVPK